MTFGTEDESTITGLATALLLTCLAAGPLACEGSAALDPQDTQTEGAGTDEPDEPDDTASGSDLGQGEALCEGDDPTLERPEHWYRDSHCKFEDPDYDRLFPDDEVQRLELSMSAADAQAMYDDLEAMLGPFGSGELPPPGPGGATADPIYVPTTLEYDGRRWTDVGMRYKGNSSLKYPWAQGIKKLSFRLNFDEFADEIEGLEDQRFWGFRELTFASAYKDPSFLRERVSTEILRDFGVPAAKSSYVEIWVDQGEGSVYWGVYVMVEDPSDELIDDQFEGGGDGNLYKPDGPGADWTHFDPAGFEKKTHEEAGDWSDVEAAIEALQADRSDDAAWRAGLEARFDVAHFLRALAVNQTLQNWDTYGLAAHNYYLYADPGDEGRLTWIPWDLNLTFFEGSADKQALSILLDEVSGEQWPLIRYVLDDAVYRSAYLSLLAELRDEAFDDDALEARMLAYHDLIEPYVDEEQAPFTHLVQPGEFAASLYDSPTAIIPKLHERRAALEDALE